MSTIAMPELAPRIGDKGARTARARRENDTARSARQISGAPVIQRTCGNTAPGGGVGGAKMVHVGYWAHARRKFVDAVKVNRQDAAAISMVTHMDAPFLSTFDPRGLLGRAYWYPVFPLRHLVFGGMLQSIAAKTRMDG